MKSMIACMLVFAALTASAAETTVPTSEKPGSATSGSTGGSSARFRVAVFRCHGATSLRSEGGDSSCKTNEEWLAIADSDCAGSCNIIVIKGRRTMKCGVNDFYTKQPCSTK